MIYIENNINELSYPIGRHIGKNLNKITQLAKDIESEFPSGSIAMWVRGSSGTIISGIIASKLPERVVFINYIKKPHEENHHNRYMAIKSTADYNIIVDDLISSGNTIVDILEQAAQFLHPTLIDAIFVTGMIWQYQIDKFMSTNMVSETTKIFGEEFIKG